MNRPRHPHPGGAMPRIRVAILGTSFGRLVQAPGFLRHPGFELVAIAGRDAARTARIAAELGVPKGYGDWRELLERERPELVSIVTPVDLHHDMMLAAIAAGAHVLCEKPTALHRWQAIAMRDAALAAGKVAGINHEFRFFPARAHAVALVREGAIGRPRRGEILGRYPIWARADSRPMTWLAAAPPRGRRLPRPPRPPPPRRPPHFLGGPQAGPRERAHRPAAPRRATRDGRR